MVELHLGGACELRCAVCDCRATPAVDPLRALEGGGARLLLRGCPGGAPARFAEVIRAARERGFVDIVARTNALAFMRPEAAAAFAATGVHGALVPLFSTLRGVHDRIAGRPDALAHTLVGMRALAAAGLAIEVEIPLLSPRLQDLEALVDLAHRAVPALRAARFFVPAQPVPPALAPPSWTEGAAGLAAALRRCRALGIPVSLRGNDGVPLCALRDAPDLYDVYRFDPRARVRLPAGATQGDACGSCAAREQCVGRTASYRAAHGDAGLAAYARKPPEMYAQRSAGSPVFTAAHHRAASKVAMVVLRPTVNCNQDCPFCSANETSNNVWTDPGTMLRAIARAARRGVERVSFSGGEPTLSRDLVHYVSAARRLGIPKIEIVTNGVLLDDPRRVEALRDAGLTHAFVSLHAHDERLSRVMTQKVGDHPRTVQAVKNLVDAGVETVINHVVTARNYPYLKQFIDFAQAELGGRAMISFALVTPQYKALEDLSVVPRLSDVAPYLRRALHRAVEVGQAVVIGSRQGIPPCFLGEFAGWSDVLKLASEAASEDAPQKQRSPACDECRYARQCTGLWKPYVTRYGLAELQPVRGAPFSDDELAEIHRIAQPSRWGAPMAFEGLHERMRDRAREIEGRAWYEAEVAAPPPLRSLPLLVAQRSRPLRVALVGSGRQARRLARAARNVRGLSIDAVASPSAPEADLRELGGCPSFRDLDEAADAIRPEALIIAAATPAHHALALAALARGIPALLEKPLARTEAEAEDLVRAAAERPDVVLLPAHNMLFAAGVSALFAAEGLPHLAYTHRCPPGSPDALRVWSRAGLFEVLFHALSLVGHAAGGGAPRITRAHHQGDGAPERVGIELSYPAAQAELTLDFAATADETVLARRAHAAGPPAMIWRRAGPVTTLRLGDREVPIPREGNDVERMLAHFRDVVLGKEKPLVTPRDALDVMRAARAALDALDAAGAPFDRPNAPRHVASPALAAFPRSPGAR
jgi:MoaA/NifB/PqqE/SkfB family radical SAM enzyme/predicted dehydrogenase